MIGFVEHKYGSRVKLFQSPSLNGWLADLCAPETMQPQINTLVRKLYLHLLRTVVDLELPKEAFSRSTRMTATHPDARVLGEKISPKHRAIVVNLARAGTWPSHLCYEALHDYLAPQNLRQDHIFASRSVDPTDKVSGSDFGASKIGGDQAQASVFFPDPMGATGHTILAAVDHYKKHVPGKAFQYLALHLIVTPEYLKRTLQAHPDIKIFALRLDRGLSSQAVLASTPGTHWDQERGLNDKDYIVPGGGGLGEVMNNSFV